MTCFKEAGSAPTCVYPYAYEDNDGSHSSSSNSLSVPSLAGPEEAEVSCSDNTCSIQPELPQNPEEILSAFDNLTLEQKNAAIAAAASRTIDPLQEWTPPSRDECPICFIPLPIDDKSTCYRPCCGKIICKGCIADQIQMFIRDSGGEMQEDMIKALNQCMFCRTNMYGKSDELNRAAAENNRPEESCREDRRYTSRG